MNLTNSLFHFTHKLLFENIQCEHKVWNKIHNSVKYVMFLSKSLKHIDYILKNAIL
jgi:hypothetical protein